MQVESTPIVDAVCSKAPSCRREIFESTLALAIELAQEGREGHPLGALFTLGSAEAVMACSRPLILDPLSGHTPAATHITDRRLRGTIKELAQLDGAFVVADDGIVVAACRYLDVPAEGISVPLGLGSRHVAAAAVSRLSDVVAIVVSASGALRVFCHGELWAEVEHCR
ncbi:MAG TPA: diadenylate cyclase [Gemmatimonadales bacterium]|nr:diadenylate cyclase [Gemmatimonadales bacterium]